MICITKGLPGIVNVQMSSVVAQLEVVVAGIYFVEIVVVFSFVGQSLVFVCYSHVGSLAVLGICSSAVVESLYVSVVVALFPVSLSPLSVFVYLLLVPSSLHF